MGVLRHGVKAALPNTQKQIQRGCQFEETKHTAQMKEKEKNSRKRTKQNGDKQSIRCRVQNTL